jgi:hypothetical protein
LRSAAQNFEVSGRWLNFDGIRSIMPVVETAPPQKSQFRGADSASSVARAANVD